MTIVVRYLLGSQRWKWYDEGSGWDQWIQSLVYGIGRYGKPLQYCRVISGIHARTIVEQINAE